MSVIVSLFVIVKKWKQPKYPLTDEQINKIYTTEPYSARKRNEALMILSERRQFKKRR